MEEKQIWILECDASFQHFYKQALGLHYQLRFFLDWASLHAAFATERAPVHLVLTEIHSLDNSPHSFLSSSAEWFPKDVPLLVVSAVDDVDIVRRCFAKGAGDYLTKPISRSELIVKVERAMAQQKADPHRYGSYLIDPTSLRVCRGNVNSLPLTSKEFQILTTLRQSENQTMTRDDLVMHVWNSVRVGSKTLDVHLFHLRKKLSPLRLEIVFRPPNAYSLLEAPEVTLRGEPVVPLESLPGRSMDLRRT